MNLNCPLQGGSAALPAGLAMGNVEPLRQSLVELALGDPALREQLRASLAAYDGLAAAAGGPLGQQHQRLAGDPLGLADEDAQLNMASPVLPTRPCSACDTPAEGGGDEDAAAACHENSVAKRNLMDVLRSKESAPPARQAQQPRQPPPFVHPQQSLQHAARPQPAGGAHQQQLHLQPWQRQRQGSRPGSGGASAAAPQGRPSSAGPAKASHVSLAQLLAGPSAKQASAAAADSAQDVLRPRQAAPAGPQRPRRHNSGSKRGREALGASRPPSGKWLSCLQRDAGMYRSVCIVPWMHLSMCQPSVAASIPASHDYVVTPWASLPPADDAPVFTPKQQRRDLSKPSYRSETLHQKLSPQPVRAPAAGGSGAEVPGGSQPQARRQPQPRQAAAAPGASAPAAARLKAGASVSAPVSPLRGASLVPSGLQRGARRSVPSSPEVGVPRLNRAATVRAAASQVCAWSWHSHSCMIGRQQQAESNLPLL